MLIAYITDLDRKPLTRIDNALDVEVEIPISDARTAKVTISTRNPACKLIKPLEVLLKIYYKGLLVFWGPVLTPLWKSAAGTPGELEINAHDPSLAWKKNNCRYGDRAVDDGVPYDGRGIWRIAECAIPGPGAMAWSPPAKAPLINWYAQIDTSQRWYHSGSPTVIMPWVPADHGGLNSPPRPVNILKPVSGEGAYTVIERGTNCFEAIQSLTEAIIGPEWRLKPVEASSMLSVAHLETSVRFGTDRTDSVLFQRGFGVDNVTSLEWTPDGDRVVNYDVEVWPGGEAGRRDTTHKALAYSKASWQKYGIYERWQASPTRDQVSILRERAKLQVKVFHDPPDFFNIVPAIDSVNTVQYGRDFFEGDTIRASVRDGFMEKTVLGRIKNVTLTADDTAQTKATIQCVPTVLDTIATSDPGT